MNINLKNDYSFLFSSLTNRSSSSSLGNMNFLSDYYSIKNGSYGKLLKAYYNKVGSSNTTASETEDTSSKLSASLSKDSAKTLTAIDKSADKLKESADKLTNKGNGSLFQEKEVTIKNEDGTSTTAKQYDVNAIYSAVSDFVNNYNSLIDTAGKSDASGVKTAVSNMTNITGLYSRTLEKVGISVGTDHKLTLDEKTFKASDISKLKSVFNDSPSFAHSMSAQASYVDNAASREAIKANTYSNRGTYSSAYSAGSLFDSLF